MLALSTQYILQRNATQLVLEETSNVDAAGVKIRNALLLNCVYSIQNLPPITFPSNTLDIPLTQLFSRLFLHNKFIGAGYNFFRVSPISNLFILNHNDGDIHLNSVLHPRTELYSGNYSSTMIVLCISFAPCYHAVPRFQPRVTAERINENVCCKLFQYPVETWSVDGLKHTRNSLNTEAANRVASF